ncbi:MAG: hypothetical protein QF441_16920 [Bacteriovoracaceae bacterium]|jgi:hypothetical protein|nr:hypothetical protein [Halobacteriovoraceae bacterium]MDP7322288.1 hypothetical protein [Bacteriovoracaceae bacterium]
MRLYLLTIISLIFCLPAYALTGTITVLEAPLFSKPDEKSKILQYYRKGDDLFIHSKASVKEIYDEELLRLTPGVSATEYNDPFLDQQETNQLQNIEHEKFYKTLTRRGKEAYILKEHVFLNYKDKRELTQKTIDFDHTDYRITEPLPSNYPLKAQSGYRGLYQFAIGRPNYSPYPYRDKIIDTDYNFIKEFQFVWSKEVPLERQKRFFFGFMTAFHFSSMKYLLNTQKSIQKNLRLYLGPYASYDIYQTKKNALTLFSSVQAILFDQMKIRIDSTEDAAAESRTYNSPFGLTALFGFQYQFFKNIHIFDTVIGAQSRITLPKKYIVRDASNNPQFWQSSSDNDSYQQELSTEVSLFIALQHSY